MILAVLGSLSACGGNDDEPPPARQLPNAAQACATLSGKTIGGAALAAVSMAASFAITWAGNTRPRA